MLDWIAEEKIQYMIDFIKKSSMKNIATASKDFCLQFYTN